MRLTAIFAAVLWLSSCAAVDNATDRTQMQVQGAQLQLNGQITSRTPTNFIALLNMNPQLRTVVLLDMAGSLDEVAVHKMGYALRARGLDTHLTQRSEIYSGAVSLFLAGNRRTADPRATVGVHSWANGFGEGGSYPMDARAHARNTDYTRDMLGSDAFYWFTLQAAPSDGIHVMTRTEIARFGLLTE